jgi:hypothetical protein
MIVLWSSLPVMIRTGFGLSCLRSVGSVDGSAICRPAESGALRSIVPAWCAPSRSWSRGQWRIRRPAIPTLPPPLYRGSAVSRRCASSGVPCRPTDPTGRFFGNYIFLVTIIESSTARQTRRRGNAHPRVSSADSALHAHWTAPIRSSAVATSTRERAGTQLPIVRAIMLVIPNRTASFHPWSKWGGEGNSAPK